MRAQLVVGAPVHERAWVLDHWFQSLLAQLGTSWLCVEQTHLVFAFGPGHDDTLDVLQDYQDRFPWAGFDIYLAEGPNLAERKWDYERYCFMADLRNQLLEHVRDIAPRYYLSLDTDILLSPGCLEALCAEMRAGAFDGIAPLTYMTPTGIQAPNAMNYGWTTRPLLGGTATTQVGACFGAVLMDSELMCVDYQPHNQGEDIGWAVSARHRGLRLAICPAIRAKHVMEPKMLDEVDERVGF